VANWFKYATMHNCKDKEIQKFDFYKQIVMYLYCGNLNAAVKLCFQNGKHNLALLIAQHPVKPSDTKEFEEALNDDVREIFDFLNGFFAYNDSVDWKSNFGRALWY
jgi:hypothetical protein